MTKYDNSRIAYLLGIFLLLSTSVYAATCTNTAQDTLQIENARPYNDIGSSFTIKVYYRDLHGNPIQQNATQVQISFQNATYNLTNNTNYWSVTLTSNLSEDVIFVVNATNNYYYCKTVQFTGRWRTPFYVSVDLYKDPLNSTDPARYTNDFQYVVFVNNAEKNADDMTVWAFNRGVDNLFNTLVGWAINADARDLKVDPLDRNIYFWGRYSLGEATIKLYEPGNYTVYVMNNKVLYPVNYFYEFERPTTRDVEYMGNVYDKLAVYDLTNVTNTPYALNNTIFRVSLTKFEANAYYAWMNIGIILVAIVLYIVGFLIVMYLAAGMQNGGQIVFYYIIGAGAILMGVIFYVH